MKRALCSLLLLLLGGLMPLAAQCNDAYQNFEGPISGAMTGHIVFFGSGAKFLGSAVGSFGLNKSLAGSDPDTVSALITATLDCATGTITIPVATRILFKDKRYREDDQFTGQFTGTIQVNSRVSGQGAQREPYAGTSRTEEGDGGGQPGERIASGTWSISNNRITCSGSWSASTRPGYTGSPSSADSVSSCSGSIAPPPAQDGAGTVTTTPPPGQGGVGNISNAPPPGLDGAGEVPGPASLPEAVVGIVVPGLLAVLIGLKNILDGGTAPVTPPPPDSSADSTPAPAAATSDYGPEYDRTIKDGQDAHDKCEAMKQQLVDFERTADRTDPQYAVNKQAYLDYLDYYKRLADYNASQASGIAAAAEQARNTRVLKGADGRDYEIVYDPRSGKWRNTASGSDFDPDQFNRWQEDLAKDRKITEAESEKSRLRQDPFSQEMDRQVAVDKQRAAAAAYVARMQVEAVKQGLWNPGGPGDVVGETDELMKNIYAGKPIDWRVIQGARKVIGDSITGATATESSLDNQAGLTDTVSDAAWGTLRETMTGKDAQGNATLAGTAASLFGRLVAGLSTGGKSEAVYTWANMLYAQDDAALRGAPDVDIFKAGFYTGLAEAGPTVAGGAVMHYFPKGFPNVAAGIGEMTEPIGKTVGEAVGALDDAVQSGSKSLSDRLSKLFTKAPEAMQSVEAVASAVPEAMQSVEAAASAVPEAMQSVEAAASAVPEAMQPMRAEVSRVLASTDPADLAKLYSEGGMDRLANLQKAGALSTDEAKILNARLAQRVNQNIDNAMRDTIDQFEGQTGVRVKSSVLGDSGSSARPGGNPKIKTDFDVTHSTNFDKADLRHYAAKRSLETGKPMNFAQADAELQELYGKQLEANVDKRLIADKFSGGVKDVDFKRYDGIGKSAGQADAYPPGYTGSRQAVQGRGKIFEVGEDGAISSHNISGQAVVDQHGLNQLAVTGELPPNSTRFGADEFKDFSAQQVKSVTEHSDVKSLAKAMGRESDLAARVDSMAGNQVQARQLANAKLPTTPPQLNKDLVKLSKQLELFPSETEKILAAHGLDEASFADAVRGHIFRYHAAIGGSLVF